MDITHTIPVFDDLGELPSQFFCIHKIKLHVFSLGETPFKMHLDSSTPPGHEDSDVPEMYVVLSCYRLTLGVTTVMTASLSMINSTS